MPSSWISMAFYSLDFIKMKKTVIELAHRNPREWRLYIERYMHIYVLFSVELVLQPGLGECITDFCC